MAIDWPATLPAPFSDVDGQVIAGVIGPEDPLYPVRASGLVLETCQLDFVFDAAQMAVFRAFVATSLNGGNLAFAADWLALIDFADYTPAARIIMPYTAELLGGAAYWRVRVAIEPADTLPLALVEETVPATEGNLYATGRNDLGQLGVASATYGSSVPLPVLDGLTVTQLAGGLYHCLALGADGTLWSCGRNNYGQLGQGDTTDRYTWQQVGASTDWASIGAGFYTSFAVKTDGTLWACGANASYEAGFATGATYTGFTQVGVATNWVAAAGGRAHMVALTSAGDLYGSGQHSDGQLGYGEVAPYYLAGLTSLAVANVTAVSCGEYATVAIKTGNQLWVTGQNGSGELGLGHTDKVYAFAQVAGAWAAASTGYSATLAVKTDGTLWAAGWNQYGQLMMDTEAVDEAHVFTQIGTAANWVGVVTAFYRSFAIDTAGNLYGAGIGAYGQLGVAADYYYTNSHYGTNDLRQIAGTWSAAAVTWYGSLFLDGDGAAWVAGRNYYGALGTGVAELTQPTRVNDTQWETVACGPDFAIAIAADDGTVWGTGVCDSGQLGLGDYPQRGGCRWQFTRITGLGGGWQQASCGNSFAVLRKDGVLYGAGSKGSGRLASSASSGYFYEFTQISDKTDWVFVDAGEAFTFAIDAAGNLWATGLNSSTAEGCLGLGDGVNKTVFTQCAGTGWAQVSGGWTHAAAVRADGTLWTTGDNSAGQLGQGDNTRRTSWTQVGAGTSWAACCCGNKFTLAVKTDGTLWAAGLNTYGQLGLGDNTSRNVFVQLSGTWPASLAAGLPLLAAGEDHCAALTLESALAATGRNNYYQLGDTTTADATVMTAAAPSVPTGEAVDEWAAVGCTDYGTIVLRSP